MMVPAGNRQLAQKLPLSGLLRAEGPTCYPIVLNVLDKVYTVNKISKKNGVVCMLLDSQKYNSYHVFFSDITNFDGKT